MHFFAIDPKGTWCREQGVALLQTSTGYELSIVVTSPNPEHMMFKSAVNQLRYKDSSARYTYDDEVRRSGSLSNDSDTSAILCTITIEGYDESARILHAELTYEDQFRISDYYDIESVVARLRSKSIFSQWGPREYHLVALEWLARTFPYICHNTKHFKDLVMDYRRQDTVDPSKVISLLSMVFNRIASRHARERDLAYLTMRRGLVHVGGADGSFSCPFRDAASALNNANLRHLLTTGKPIFTKKEAEETFIQGQLHAS